MDAPKTLRLGTSGGWKATYTRSREKPLRRWMAYSLAQKMRKRGLRAKVKMYDDGYYVYWCYR